MKKMNLKGVSAQTWVRTFILVIALVNQALVMLGISKNEIDLESWAGIGTYILTVVTAVWSWWKNNSFTADAQNADEAYNLK